MNHIDLQSGAWTRFHYRISRTYNEDIPTEPTFANQFAYHDWGFIEVSFLGFSDCCLSLTIGPAHSFLSFMVSASTRNLDYCGSSTISNHPVTGSIIVKHINSITEPSLPVSSHISIIIVCCALCCCQHHFISSPVCAIVIFVTPSHWLHHISTASTKTTYSENTMELGSCIARVICQDDTLTNIIIRPSCLIACSNYEPTQSDDDNDSLDGLTTELSGSRDWFCYLGVMFGRLPNLTQLTFDG